MFLQTISCRFHPGFFFSWSSRGADSLPSGRIYFGAGYTNRKFARFFQSIQHAHLTWPNLRFVLLLLKGIGKNICVQAWRFWACVRSLFPWCSNRFLLWENMQQHLTFNVLQENPSEEDAAVVDKIMSSHVIKKEVTIRSMGFYFLLFSDFVKAPVESKRWDLNC